MTLPDLILTAAAGLPEPFTREALAVAAWQLDKPRIGLAGYEDTHPNCNRVFSALDGNKGMVARGLLSKAGNDYRLTEAGRHRVARLNGAKLPDYPRLPRTLESWLVAKLGSDAVEMFDARKADVTFAHACRLWGIGEADNLDDRLKAFKAQLTALEQSLDGHAMLAGDMIVDASSARYLANIHSYLLDRFDRHLTIMRRRKAV